MLPVIFLRYSSHAWSTQDYYTKSYKKCGENTTVYVQNTEKKRPATVILRSFTEHHDQPLEHNLIFKTKAFHSCLFTTVSRSYFVITIKSWTVSLITD